MDNEKFSIGPTDGSKTIWESEMFESVDINFRDWGLNVSGERKPSMIFVTKLVTEDSVYKKIFNPFGDKVISTTTQMQIIEFARMYAGKLKICESVGLFLFTKGDEPLSLDGENGFVARVGVEDSGLLTAEVDYFFDEHVWRAQDRYLKIFPFPIGG